MSLTTFIHDKAVRRKFYTEFKKPLVPGRPEPKYKPLTNHYILVGTAFDYMARLYLLRMYPKARCEETVAEFTAEQLTPSDKLTDWTGIIFGMSFDIVQELLNFPMLTIMQGAKKPADEPCSYPFLLHKEARLTETVMSAYAAEVQDIVNEAKETRERYVSGGRVPIKKLAEQCLKLAQIDPIYRAGRPDPWLGVTDPKDIEDLVALFHLFEKQKWLRGKKLIFLNPSFGKGSRMVGNADADLILDDLLVDIKCTQKRTFFGGLFHQLLGYYILSSIGGVGDPPKPRTIRHLGVYYARHGELLTFQVQSFIAEDELPNVQKWFKQLAKKTRD